MRIKRRFINRHFVRSLVDLDNDVFTALLRLDVVFSLRDQWACAMEILFKRAWASLMSFIQKKSVFWRDVPACVPVVGDRIHPCNCIHHDRTVSRFESFSTTESHISIFIRSVATHVNIILLWKVEAIMIFLDDSLIFNVFRRWNDGIINSLLWNLLFSEKVIPCVQWWQVQRRCTSETNEILIGPSILLVLFFDRTNSLRTVDPFFICFSFSSPTIPAEILFEHQLTPMTFRLAVFDGDTQIRWSW